jgi:hypothetical protein
MIYCNHHHGDDSVAVPAWTARFLSGLWVLKSREGSTKAP